jgi:hypothetical protein
MAEQQAKQALKNEKVGEVVSTKMQKTIVVEVSRRVPHPVQAHHRQAEEVLRARRRGHGEDGRRGAHRGVPAAEQAEAVALAEVSGGRRRWARSRRIWT